MIIVSLLKKCFRLLKRLNKDTMLLGIYKEKKEKNAMQKIWKEREKQLEKVLLNTTNFYGSVKGIAGNAISDIKLLELGGETEE